MSKFALMSGLVGAMLALSPMAQAADITGAGATFPFPIYAKRAEAYKKGNRYRPELSVHRFFRRHPPDPRQDRGLRCDRRPGQR